MKETVKIGEKEYRLGFDFSVIIEAEEVLGQAFSFDQLSTQKGKMAVVYGAIKSFNRTVPKYADFVHQITPRDMAMCEGRLSQMMTEFYAVSAVAEDHVKSDSEDEEEGEEREKKD